MKQRNLAILAGVALSAIAAIPTVAQAAEEISSRTNQCRTANDVRTQYGLPTVDCASLEKTSSGVMGPVRSMDAGSGERPTMQAQSPTPGSAGNLTQW